LFQTVKRVARVPTPLAASDPDRLANKSYKVIGLIRAKLPTQL
jgi:hypothetical protein